MIIHWRFQCQSTKLCHCPKFVAFSGFLLMLFLLLSGAAFFNRFKFITSLVDHFIDIRPAIKIINLQIFVAVTVCADVVIFMILLNNCLRLLLLIIFFLHGISNILLQQEAWLVYVGVTQALAFNTGFDGGCFIIRLVIVVVVIFIIHGISNILLQQEAQWLVNVIKVHHALLIAFDTGFLLALNTGFFFFFDDGFNIIDFFFCRDRHFRPLIQPKVVQIVKVFHVRIGF
mmetsp:Transcript_1964/g.4238  ORF Transcript_1964/g.4238 Transcript_1964/m.4238 type:complete len:230 (-) Transcript_1964:704-1393(-)